MEWDEWKNIAKGLKAAYPATNFLPDEYSLKLWYTLLKDKSYNAVAMACQKYMLTNHFPPALADIREAVAECTQPRAADWTEAFADVNRAISAYGYMGELEALEKMDESTRETVRRIGWQNLCTETNEIARRAGFRDTYNAIVARTKERAILPVDFVRRLEDMKPQPQTIEQKEEPETAIEAAAEYDDRIAGLIERLKRGKKAQKAN